MFSLAPRSGPSEDPCDQGQIDAQLVERIRLGDRSAEERLYRRHAPRIASLCARLLGSRRDTEDVVHDTFLRALTHLHTLRTPERVGPWLVQIAVNQVRSRQLRRAVWGFFSAEAEAEADEQALALAVDPRASPQVRAELVLLDAVLQRVPWAARTAWVLRFVEGASLQEVADALQCSLATAKRRIARADETVRAHVQLEEPRHG